MNGLKDCYLQVKTSFKRRRSIKPGVSVMTPSIMASNGRTHAMTRDPPENTSAAAGYQAFDHILWYVGNAKQAASYYVTRMGFKHVAYVTPSQFMYLLILFREGSKRA